MEGTMDRETLIRWILILCSKTLFIRFRAVEGFTEESIAAMGAEGWPGGDVQQNLSPPPPEAASVSAA
jgi:hypothetical protein